MPFQDRMQRQRFELKYLVSETTALNLRSFLRGYLEFDEASVGQPGYSYRVNSIYLDSERLRTFRDWVNSNRNRFKLRMRFYDCAPETPVFLEIKRRVCGCILKERCAITKQTAPLVLAGQIPTLHADVSDGIRSQMALENFVSMTALLQARPTAVVTYWREAYVDPGNDNLRLTLDREVRIALCSNLDYSLGQVPYVQPFGDRVILELKFNNRFPDWSREMVQAFNLSRGAAAKYCEGIASLCFPEHANCPTCPVNAPLVEAPPHAHEAIKLHP